MTRRHYTAFANAIAEIDDPKIRRIVAELVADVCRSDNSRFDRERFYDVCGVR